jgi:hypothetical protein
MSEKPQVATGEAAEDGNTKYCERLMELAEVAEVSYPETQEIDGEIFDKESLRQRLGSDRKLRGEVVKKFGFDPRLAKDGAKNADNMIDMLFGPCVEIQGSFYPKDTLLEVLAADPKLQQRLAARTAYVPSKWLLEQEMKARGVKGAGYQDVYKIAAKERLTGVCFSGGGIRSATFNLGVMQGLAQLDVLPHIDYLSSVSGGGYIHEFLAGWILRNGTLSSVMKELIPQAEPECLPRAPEPIQWLKRYASYLTPRRGVFSTDTWTAIAIWLRNTILNQIPILAAFAFAFFLVHLLLPEPIEGWHPGLPLGVAGRWGWSVGGALLLAWAMLSLLKLWRNLRLQEDRVATRKPWAMGPMARAAVARWAIARRLGLKIPSIYGLIRDLRKQGKIANLRTGPGEDLMTNGAVVAWVIAPWLGCSLWVSYWVQTHGAADSLWYWGPIAVLCVLMLAMVEVAIFAGGVMRAYANLNPETGRWRTAWALIGFAAGGVLATAVAAALGWAVMEATRWASAALSEWIHAALGAKDAVNQSLSFTMSQVSGGVAANVTGAMSMVKDSAAGMTIDPWRIRLALLPALLLSLPYVAIELTVGLLGRDYGSIRREWLARLRAWSLLYALLWAGVVGLVLVGPYLGYYIEGKGLAWIWSSLIAFAAAHGATIFAGWSGKADGKPTEGAFLGLKPMDLLAMIAAPIAIVSMLLLLSFGTSVGVDKLTWRLAECPLTLGSKWLPFVTADILCLLSAVLVALLLGWRVDINEFSMHAFYRNRLSRCYLGATVPGRRQPDPFTGFDDRSRVTGWDGWMRDLTPRLRDLLPFGYRRPPDRKGKPGKKGKYDGPFPIFCATLNLTTGEDLATQERKGTSFAFTPLLSGYSVGWTDGRPDKKVSYNGYVPTDEYAYRGGGIDLDSVVAISGAALNPNQGYNSNPALAFLMTFFNVRLGWWISNPRKTDVWPAKTGRSTPQFALLHLFKELFGAVGDGADYVNLSDGGHFENMGLYELVRRRCRYIVVCDAEEDSEMKFEGIGGAITKCRADFGAEIDLDLRPLQIQEDTGYSKAHCVVGTIRYPAPPGAETKAKAAMACECLGDEGDDEYTGVIVYLKSSLVGDEPADLLAHQLKSPAFPQDSTANQWFTETLFEAYRRLGHHIVMTAIQPALSPQETKVKDRGEIPELFDRMYSIWYPRTPEMEKYHSDHVSRYEGILKELRERKELVGLEERLNDQRKTGDLPTKPITDRQGNTTDLPYVDWKPPQDPPQSELYATQFAVALVDLMYTIYTDSQLAFPDNRVSPHAQWWICLFRRWCRVDFVQDTWTTHELVYSEEFRLFAKRELGLP